MRVPGLRIDVHRLQQSIDELAKISESPPPVATGLHMDAALAALTNGAPNHPLIDV